MATDSDPEIVKPAQEIDIWDLLQRSVEANPRTKPSAAATDAHKSAGRKWRSRVLFWLLDLTGTTLWIYVVLKLFVVDIDRIIVDAVSPSIGWLLGYKVLVVLLVVIVGASFFWKWGAVLSALYIAFFPLVVLFWKLPNLVVKLRLYRSWVFWMLLLNGFVAFFRNLRYHLVSKSLAVIAVSVIVFANSRFLLAPAAAVLLILFLVAAGRVMVDTFQPSRFLGSQKKAIEWVTSAFITPSVRWQDEITTKSDTDVLTTSEVNALSGKIQLGIIATHGLYLWAYKLQQYREKHLAFLFSWSAYAWLLLGSVVSFALLNTAVLKIDAGQYRF